MFSKPQYIYIFFNWNNRIHLKTSTEQFDSSVAKTISKFKYCLLLVFKIAYALDHILYEWSHFPIF